MLIFSASLHSLVEGARDIAASVIAPALDTEHRAARRPAPATFVLAEDHPLSATISAAPVPTASLSLLLTGVSGA